MKSTCFARDSAILARLLGCCWRTGSTWRLLRLYRRTIGVGDGGRGAVAPQIHAKTIFSGKIRVKFGHFVNFHAYIFGQKCLALPKLTDLRRLWGEPDRLGSSLSRWGAAGRGGPFPLEACFFPLPRPLTVMFIQFLWHKSMMTTFASVLYRIRNDVMTASLEHQLIVTESFCALTHR